MLKPMPLLKVTIAGLAAFVLASLAPAQSAASLGTLQGSVTDRQGNPLAGAELRYGRAVKTVVFGKNLSPAPGEAVVQGVVSTDASGRFAVAGLASGSYTLCGDVPSTPYVDPCIWQQPVVVSVSANATMAQTLVLTKGVFLKVRVNDPRGLLPQAMDGIWTARRLLVGVTYANGAYQGAQNIDVDAAGRDYQLIIPSGVPFTLRLFSNHVALTDQSGAAVDVTGSRIPFQAPAGQDQGFTFAVSGPAGQVP